MVAQRLGFKTVDQLREQVDKQDVTRWIAVALLQSWFTVPTEQRDQGQQNNWHEVLEQWCNVNSATS